MKRKILFSIIFTILGISAFQISIDRVVGSNQNFTLFEFLGPVGGMFLGPVLGAVSAFVVRALNVVIFHQQLDEKYQHVELSHLPFQLEHPNQSACHHEFHFLTGSCRFRYLFNCY